MMRERHAVIFQLNEVVVKHDEHHSLLIVEEPESLDAGEFEFVMSMLVRVTRDLDVTAWFFSTPEGAKNNELKNNWLKENVTALAARTALQKIARLLPAGHTASGTESSEGKLLILSFPAKDAALDWLYPAV